MRLPVVNGSLGCPDMGKVTSLIAQKRQQGKKIWGRICCAMGFHGRMSEEEVCMDPPLGYARCERCGRGHYYDPFDTSDAY